MTEPMEQGLPIASAWLEHLAHLVEATSVTGPSGEPIPASDAFGEAKARILAVRRAGGKVMVVGNGGSAAIASHMQTDLAHSLGVRALVFTEPSTLTAQANDHGYPVAYSNLVRLWADAGDLLVAISSSGRSQNILNACEAARERGAGILSFSGFAPENPLRTRGDLNFHVASSEYGPVESAHAVLIHHLTDLILAALAQESRR
jgi:D-sedoheptulose 7-phosphate isomerase